MSEMPSSLQASIHQPWLVTGASGYLGSFVCTHLTHHEKRHCLGLVSEASNVLPEDYEPIAGNILSRNLHEILATHRPQAVIHLAAAPRSWPPSEQREITVEGTKRLLNAVADVCPETVVVVVGSAAEYGFYEEPISEDTPAQPVSDYGEVKLAQTRAALAFKDRLPVVVARVFNPYGHLVHTPLNRSLVVASLASQLAELKQNQAFPLRVHSLHSLAGIRDFIHGKDVATALIALAKTALNNNALNPVAGNIFNVGTATPNSIYTVLTLLVQQYGLSLAEVHEKLNLHHLEQQVFGGSHPEKSVAVIDKIVSATGWQPQLSLQQGLAEEAAYWKCWLVTGKPATV